MSGKQSKFTPANIRQITNLLERGKTPDEIAEIIGVTLGTLKVTCSRLGISLRRRLVTSGENEQHPNGHSVASDVQPDRTDKEHVSNVPLVPKSAPVSAGRTDLFGASLALRYRGKERLVDIPVDRALLGLLALEAEFRSTSVGNLIADLLRSIAQADLFASVLKPQTRAPSSTSAPVVEALPEQGAPSASPLNRPTTG